MELLTDPPLTQIAKADKVNHEKLTRLMDNPDFKDIILTGYFKDTLLECVDRGINTEEEREALGNLGSAISSLKQYIALIQDKGVKAIKLLHTV